jgi:hypothetical protein
MSDPERDALIAQYVQNGYCRTFEDAVAAADRFLTPKRRKEGKASRHVPKKKKEATLNGSDWPPLVPAPIIPMITIPVREHQEMLIASQYHKLKNDTLEQQNTVLQEKVAMLTRVVEDDMRAEKIAGAQCSICIEHAAVYLHVPCGHLCLCGACVVKQDRQKMQCPLCRSPSTLIIKVFTD